MYKHIAIAAFAAISSVASAGAADLDVDGYSLRSADPRIVRDYEHENRRGDWREHRVYRGIVEARGSYASDDLPYHEAEWRARRSAIEAWKVKVESAFGPRFAHWREASSKSVSCDRIGRGVAECSVSARPERGFAGRYWGSWNWRRAAY